MLELPYESILRWVEEKDNVIQLNEHINSKLFSPSITYINDATIFDGYGHRDSKFDRYCKGINEMFRKLSDRESKQQYISHYSLNNWKQLSLQQKSDIP